MEGVPTPNREYHYTRGQPFPPRRGGRYSSNVSRGRTTPFRGRMQGQGGPGRHILTDLVNKPLKTISRGNSPPMQDIVIHDLRYLGSYNWVDTEKPTIIVPGSPRIWADRPLPYKLSPDTHDNYVDQHTHRFSSCPLLPLFRAAGIMEQERQGSKFDWSSVDIITDRNSLRKLLAWADGSYDPFRVDVQLVGASTLVFHRWEPRTTDSPNGVIYMDTYERESTRDALDPALGKLVGHHRIVTYDFAGLRLVLRFEVDAYDPAVCRGAMLHVPDTQPSDVVDELAHAMASLSTTSSLPSSEPTVDADGLHIIRAGAAVSQEALIKIKTRSKKSIMWFDWKLIYPQLFLGQIPRLYIGVHGEGTFDEVRKKSIDAPELKPTARIAQERLKKLRYTLEEIHNFAMTHGARARLSLVCIDGEPQVMERKSADGYLPVDVLSLFT